VTFDNGISRRLDRVGRPEITNLSLNMNQKIVGTDGIDIRDKYNLDPSFLIPPANASQYAARLSAMISKYDKLDGVQDWSDAKLAQLTSILVDDFQIVDPASPNCQSSHYFEIEKSLLQGQVNKTCGGRDPSDNSVNKLYTIYAHGPNYAAEVSADLNDGVNSPTVKLSQTFPYLAGPDDSIMAGIKRLAALLF
jgi:hypothetical protein